MKYIIDTDKLPCNNGKNCTTCPFWSIDDTCEITEQVKKLPKYEEIRPHGEWIYHKEWELDGECAFECSKCGMGTDVDYNFCPNCGADMRKEGERNE